MRKGGSMSSNGWSERLKALSNRLCCIQYELQPGNQYVSVSALAPRVSDV